MLYLNTQDIETLGIDWNKTIEVIEQAVHALQVGDFDQPIKPYLRYNDFNNRIIAMPAYIGGTTNFAGIKWISSFPNNIHQGLKRAHSVTILNHSETGKPLAFFNTALISGVRTASVSGLMIKYFDKSRLLQDITVGIIGFGPIGQLHLNMINSLLGDRISEIILYDIGGIKSELIPGELKDRVIIAESWEEAYSNADIFITCTVSSSRYVDKEPKRNSLLLNVSLRDFQPSILNYTNSIIVDEWEEVCRENTDIELMYKTRGLQKEDTYSIIDVVCNNQMERLPLKEAIMFNPMGMAIFDIAIAAFYYNGAMSNGVGTILEEESLTLLP
ncbi:2,3-diaminopropionate biosynthesis protein SbnB [Lysinibacillus sp. NPDC056959]|uniref:2,3-diaminopropionate biosynthesis protein SbnB n=1 Tax=Lysinibacillus sp. NPDC056959 TaxID=3345981 RepID=UPI003629B6BF